MLEFLFSFWVLLPILFIMLLVCEENSAPGIGLFLLVVILGAREFYVGFEPGYSIFAWCKYHPWWTVGFAACYLPAGMAWSIYRWHRHVGKRKDDFNEWIISREGQQQYTWWIDREHKDRTEETLAEWVAGQKENFRPVVRHNKSRIMAWIGYWPLSAVWYFCSDFLVEIWESAYRQLVGVFEKITARNFD